MPHLQLASIPDLIALQAAEPTLFPYLLQSSANVGWDILFYSPGEAFCFDEARIDLVFPDLDAQCRAALAPPGTEDDFLPFRGGWFIYLGYEMLRAIEPSVPAPSGSSDFPVAAFARASAAILVDRGNGRAWAVAEPQCAELLPWLLEKAAGAGTFDLPALSIEVVHEEAPNRFLAGVDRIKRYILDGDVFQVNLSREWQVELAAGVSPAGLHARLRNANPAPFSGLASFGQHHIVSSSPERLLRIRDGIADTRPIAGTHPRSTDPEEDQQLRQRLIDSVKERAEHVMLIDLERNDLGRICVPGTVEVDELMAVCTYAFVHHIESNVRGKLKDSVSAVAAIRAVFPGGTITGCPKIRTMQIISELETGPRRAYTGSMGYLNRDGSMDLNILIRTFMLDGQTLRFRAGAGIVADSEPGRELLETRAKAKGLLRALGLAG